MVWPCAREERGAARPYSAPTHARRTRARTRPVPSGLRGERNAKVQNGSRSECLLVVYVQVATSAQSCSACYICASNLLPSSRDRVPAGKAARRGIARIMQTPTLLRIFSDEVYWRKKKTETNLSIQIPTDFRNETKTQKPRGYTPAGKERIHLRSAEQNQCDGKSGPDV